MAIIKMESYNFNVSLIFSIKSIKGYMTTKKDQTVKTLDYFMWDS